MMIRSSLFILTISLLLSPISGGLFPSKVNIDDEEIDAVLTERYIGHFDEVVAAPVTDIAHNRALSEVCGNETAICYLGALFGGSDLYRDCGGLFDKTDRFCYDEDMEQDVCCGDESDCCDINVGKFLGVLAALSIIVAVIIIGCCYCCKCCCCYDRLHGNQPGHGDPVTHAYPAPGVPPPGSQTYPAVATVAHIDTNQAKPY